LTHVFQTILKEGGVTRDFMLMRGLAVSDYAHYEAVLSLMFSQLLGAPPDVAGVPFFKINNSRARTAILERLLHKKHDNTYNSFWNSYVKWSRVLDADRNNIVHWGFTNRVFGTDVQPRLEPPNFWDKTPTTPDMGIADLFDFSERCEFARETLNQFIAELGGFGHPTWHGIFLQPLTYPPPPGHPRYSSP
jgi:hypothetical protein